MVAYWVHFFVSSNRNADLNCFCPPPEAACLLHIVNYVLYHHRILKKWEMKHNLYTFENRWLKVMYLAPRRTYWQKNECLNFLLFGRQLKIFQFSEDFFNTQKMGKSSITGKKAGYLEIRFNNKRSSIWYLGLGLQSASQRNK